MKEIQQITLDISSLQSIVYFNNLVHEIIETERTDYTTKIYDTRHSKGDYWTGYYYLLSDNTIFLGLRFDSDPCIFIGIDKGWNRELFMRLQHERIHAPLHDDIQVKYDLVYGMMFTLSIEVFNTLTKDEQREKMLSFFDVVNKYLLTKMNED